MGLFCGECFIDGTDQQRKREGCSAEFFPTMNLVLIEPEIPPNTGNIARLCAATRTTLHLIEPLGFSIDDRQLKRAGMDYWEQVEWRRWASWGAFMEQLPKEI